jgi:hypothetical protein
MQKSGLRLAFSLAPFVVPLAVACIEVGHDAETGCLVDSSAPGCRATGRGGAASGGTAGTRGGSTSTGGTSTGGAGGAGGAPIGGEGGA